MVRDGSEMTGGCDMLPSYRTPQNSASERLVQPAFQLSIDGFLRFCCYSDI